MSHQCHRATETTVIATGRPDVDWRAFENGTLLLAIGDQSIPAAYAYQEGLQEYQVSRDIWLRTLTVARNGEGDPSQHIIAQRSIDGKRTWSDWFDVEPEGPPSSSYGEFFRHPTTRQIYFMYTLGPPHDPLLADGEPFSGARHHVGQIAFRYVTDEGTFLDRHILDLPLRAVDLDNAFRGQYLLHYGHPWPRILLGDNGYGWYTKLGPKPMVSNGEAFVVKYIGYRHNDRLETLQLELLPAGSHGLQLPDAKCICGFAPVVFTDKQWIFKFRSTTGYVGVAISQDVGQTWDVGTLTYSPRGRPVKNPESPVGIIHDHKGRTFIAFYNDSYSVGFGSFAARDLVYISYIHTQGEHLYVSEPELFYYRKDQEGYERHSPKRLNPPNVSVAAESLVGEGSDKLELRRFHIPPSFFDILANQQTHSSAPRNGLVLESLDTPTSLIVPDLPSLSQGDGFTLSFSILVRSHQPRQVILDGLLNCGLRLLTWRQQNLLFAMSDGTHTVRLASDPDSLTPGKHHYVSVIVDGLPGLISIVIDGRLQDGGKDGERGTSRFSHNFGAPNSSRNWRTGKTVELTELRIHRRPLLTSEAIALQRAMHSRTLKLEEK